MYDFNVTLFRDSLSTPWGIRLEGGWEFRIPLTIQRVFTGSPASGDLQRGDVILAIQHRDATFMFHNQANEIIRNSGGSINLTIRRGYAYPGSTMPAYRPQPSPTYLSPKAMSKTINYSPYAPSHLFEAEDPLTSYIRSRPIEKVKDPRPILSQTGSPIMPGETPSVSYRSSVKRYRPASTLPLMPKSAPVHNYAPIQQASYMPASPTPSAYPSYPNYPNLNTVPIPFNDKRMASQLQQSLNKAVNSHTKPAPSPLSFASSTNNYPGYYHQPAAVFSQPHVSNEHGLSSPVWKDSLMPAGRSNFFGANAAHAPPPQSIHVGNLSANQPKSPKVVNLKYNSPIGLYSKENVKEELYKQVGATGQDIQFVPSSEF